MRTAGALIHEIVLAPLTLQDAAQLMADALHCDRERTTPLAELVYERTAGNPFFLIQFLTALVDEGLLSFDHSTAGWSWDLARIRAKEYTDNVADLMVGMDKLFDAFFTTKTDGMGIGLSVSRSIIERHHGRLWAEPNDGPGTTFAFAIPVAPETVARATDTKV